MQRVDPLQGTLLKWLHESYIGKRFQRTPTKRLLCHIEDVEGHKFGFLSYPRHHCVQACKWHVSILYFYLSFLPWWNIFKRKYKLMYWYYAWFGMILCFLTFSLDTLFLSHRTLKYPFSTIWLWRGLQTSLCSTAWWGNRKLWEVCSWLLHVQNYMKVPCRSDWTWWLCTSEENS